MALFAEKGMGKMIKVIETKSDGFFTKLANGKWKKWIFIGGIIAILLIFLSEFMPTKKTSGTVNTTSISADEYVVKLEEKLTSLVEKIEGAGECSVLVTLQNGVEYVYASEQKANSERVEDSGTGSSKLQESDDTEQSIIVVETDNGKKGLLVTEIQPTVKGVVVVCEGGDNEQIKTRVVDAVTTALNITSGRVCVVR